MFQKFFTAGEHAEPRNGVVDGSVCCETAEPRPAPGASCSLQEGPECRLSLADRYQRGWASSVGLSLELWMIIETWRLERVGSWCCLLALKAQLLQGEIPNDTQLKQERCDRNGNRCFGDPSLPKRHSR